ncbi:unnamed protein product [Cladocopium goreaui]|uniref:Uncharacterized protein n=1 Tax=Cladocopium goreaui TaxID=2562237 RepID=A0A9P1GR48_9DINO|nr:unnamed protein product [Cladocopium goreaui]
MDARQRLQLLEKLHGSCGSKASQRLMLLTLAYPHTKQQECCFAETCSFEKAEYLQAATVAFSLYSALDRSVRHSGEAVPASSFAVTPVLEQQRAALLMLISALTLTPEQQLLMPGPCKPSFGATGEDMASLQSWFQEATEVAHKAAVSLQEAQTMLAELDLKCNQEPLAVEP